MVEYSALHYAAKAEKNATRAGEEADRAKSYADSIEPTQFLNKRMITNCITEIPQDIKLELNNGTLTLKAGSKVYVPNGFEADGVTPKFDKVIIKKDLTFSQGSQVGANFMYVNSGGTSVSRHNNIASGTSAPEGFTGAFYNTSTNRIDYYNSGTAQNGPYSLPFSVCTVSEKDTAKVSSIDQVFNGFGYIGSTVFALPGVKGLIPNGRNEDGSLKNIEFTTDGVWTCQATYNYENATIGIVPKLKMINYVTPTGVAFNEKENKNILLSDGSRWGGCFVGKISVSDLKITSFSPKLPFRAVDANDDNIDYIVERYNSGTNWYRVYKSGWVEQGGVVASGTGNITVTFLKPFQNANYTISAQALTNSTSDKSVFASAIINKTPTSVLIRSRWSSENGVGDATLDCWKACGQGA